MTWLFCVFGVSAEPALADRDGGLLAADNLDRASDAPRPQSIVSGQKQMLESVAIA